MGVIQAHSNESITQKPWDLHNINMKSKRQVKIEVALQRGHLRAVKLPAFVNIIHTKEATS